MGRKEGWNTQVPSLLARWPADKVAWVIHGCMIIMWGPHDLGRPLHLWGCGRLFQQEFWPWIGMWWGEAQGIQLGVIGTNPWSLWDPKWGWRSKPSTGEGEMSEWDLASGIDCDREQQSLLASYSPTWRHFQACSDIYTTWGGFRDPSETVNHPIHTTSLI